MNKFWEDTNNNFRAVIADELWEMNVIDLLTPNVPQMIEEGIQACGEDSRPETIAAWIVASYQLKEK